jgi:general secretion pathway protein J
MNMRQHSCATRHTGFTLIEMLVAVAIFGIVATLAYGGLSTISLQAEVTRDRVARLQEIRRGVVIMERDILQAVPRPVRQSYQNTLEPAFRGGAGSVLDIELTRGGWRNPTGLPRASLQRVAWSFDGSSLYRLQWPVLDADPNVEPQRVEVLDGMAGFAIRFRNAAGDWQEQWPPLDPGQADSQNPGSPSQAPADINRLLPTAVEFTIDLGEHGRIRRVIEVPGP